MAAKIDPDFRVQECKPISWTEVEAYAQKHKFGILDEHKGLEGWYRCKVSTVELRNMHGAFGRDDSFIDLPKGQRLSEQLLGMKDRVEDGTFPRAPIIKSLWADKPAIYVQRTMSSGELYVADGVTRTFNSCYHGEPWLDALVITLDQERDVI